VLEQCRVRDPALPDFSLRNRSQQLHLWGQTGVVFALSFQVLYFYLAFVHGFVLVIHKQYMADHDAPSRNITLPREFSNERTSPAAAQTNSNKIPVLNPVLSPNMMSSHLVSLFFIVGGFLLFTNKVF
jgi:hypothetical protein